MSLSDATEAAARTGASGQGRIKCVVWDLDNTLWDGVLLEDDDVRPRAEVLAVIRELDRRGVLHSIASRNDPAPALRRLERLGVLEYFLHPQISWNPKSAAISAVANALNIGVDAVAFVDDQPFELAEVAFALPEVLCVPADQAPELVTRPEFQPRFVTAESRTRRAMYRSGIDRDRAEQEFAGTSEEFLSTLDMELRITPAAAEDLRRAEELTVRTNQLNSTGITYSYAELDHFRTSPDHLLLVAGLRDRFGPYGTIGLALVHTGAPAWRLKLLLTSCRVISRGVGAVLLNHVMRLAADSGRELHAELVDTGRNRLMYVTYRFAGFTEIGREGGVTVLRADLSRVQDPPGYLRVLTG
ncbi:HAD-IIIC family phosphatase [Goodfellowiella coeruleoviolacea]|uniref:HAD-superfamily phosphatase, subfamily IIIC/FkbH-like domain-containing protein n=1 Tax=Goodfellowiella coeruleoviolacea TaxID=334858 RepID=A0AAE3GIX0_9PSEU|nr:HAD-IIIC family phosphatase [Goodfellowiella coeruleoviolacea]MCP2168453.1 HAD-superfamily phosphatase, subfamily IIIC/FkbH-like domain-containing protein [Goodfellowiella coeruleoviolacea]